MFLLTRALFTILGSKDAYLDPGSGSFLLQLLIAGLLGAGIALRSQWSRIRGWFGGKPKSTEEDEEEGEDEQPK